MKVNVSYYNSIILFLVLNNYLELLHIDSIIDIVILVN